MQDMLLIHMGKGPDFGDDPFIQGDYVFLFQYKSVDLSNVFNYFFRTIII